MAEFPIGDGVLFVDDERVDGIDVRALQVLDRQVLTRVLGGIFGATSGVVSGVTFDASVPSAVKVGECVLAGFKVVPGASRCPVGVIVHYRPGVAPQTSDTVPTLVPYAATEGKPYLWFARTDVATNVASRKAWQSGAERGINPQTRQRELVIFERTLDRNTPPNASYDWYIFAQVVGWNTGIPTIRPIHIFDDGIVPASEQGQPSIWLGSNFYEQFSDVGIPGGADMALPRFLTMLTHRHMMTLDSDYTMLANGHVSARGTLGLFSKPPGLKQVNALLNLYPIAWGYVSTPSFTADFSQVTKRAASTGSNVQAGVGHYEIRVPNTYVVTHVEVTPRMQGSGATSAKFSVGVTAGSPDTVVTVRAVDRQQSIIHSTSNGVPVTNGTIHVVNGNQFPATGKILVETDEGVSVVSYTSYTPGVTGTFGGCTGGSGDMFTGGFVQTASDVPSDAPFWIAIYGQPA